MIREIFRRLLMEVRVTQTNENKLKISNPQRVARILKRICQANLQVIIKTSGDAATSVKGRAANVSLETVRPSMRISNISDKGIAHIAKQGRVQVEFVMMSTKVVFISNVVAREHNSIIITLPLSLVSIERRKNARYLCTDDSMSFINLSLWSPHPEDVTAPPFYIHHRDVAGYLSVADISFGGLCVVTRFPSVGQMLKRGMIDEKVQLILPMQVPIPIGVEVRWAKRIKEHVAIKQGKQSLLRYYRFGLQFTGQSEQLKAGVRQFIQQLSQAGAI